MFGLVRRSVSNHDLTGVLVRHDHTRLGKLRSLRVGVVGGEGLLGHTEMVVVAFLEDGPIVESNTIALRVARR